MRVLTTSRLLCGCSEPVPVNTLGLLATLRVEEAYLQANSNSLKPMGFILYKPMIFTPRCTSRAIKITMQLQNLVSI